MHRGKSLLGVFLNWLNGPRGRTEKILLGELASIFVTFPKLDELGNSRKRRKKKDWRKFAAGTSSSRRLRGAMTFRRDRGWGELTSVTGGKAAMKRSHTHFPIDIYTLRRKWNMKTSRSYKDPRSIAINRAAFSSKDARGYDTRQRTKTRNWLSSEKWPKGARSQRQNRPGSLVSDHKPNKIKKKFCTKFDL